MLCAAMGEIDVRHHGAITARLREQAEEDAMRVTIHGHQEMAEEDVYFDEVREVLLGAAVVENYPEHRRGPCCLICRRTSRGRSLHVVCTTSLEVAVIITVYEPKPPKWAGPFERGQVQ